MNDVARQVPAFVPGVFDDMPAETYHAIPALSSGGAKRIRRSAKHFRVQLTKRKEPTAAMKLGTAIHFGVLQPELFDRYILVEPEVDKRTTVGKVAWADHLATVAAARADGGREVVTLKQADRDRARFAADAVLAHPGAQELLAGATRELSLFWNDGRYGVPCKARLDLWNAGILGDVKSCGNASAEEFARDMGTYDYHVQGAHYYSGAEHALNESPRLFVFIAVETEDPYDVALYELGRASMQAGMHAMDDALQRYKEVLETGEYPGYPQTVQTLELPRWKLRFNV